jgi:hypothetical protein
MIYRGWGWNWRMGWGGGVLMALICIAFVGFVIWGCCSIDKTQPFDNKPQINRLNTLVSAVYGTLTQLSFKICPLNYFSQPFSGIDVA